MSKINILIVEDEALHAAKLEILLKELDYHVLPVAESAKEGMTTFHATQPDLVILDIWLSGDKDGIDFAKSLKQIDGRQVPVIFLTSMNDTETFDRAKETNPYAYLLKPIDRFSLQHAIELALNNMMAQKESQAANALQHVLSNGKNLFIKEQKKLYKVAVDDISAIEVDGKYCKVYTPDRNLLVRTSMKEFLKKMPGNTFLQTHRNYLVNVNAILEIELDNDLITTAQISVPISKNYKSAIVNNLNFLK